MNGRQTSGLMFSYINKSAYHESCVPAEKRAIQTESKTYKEAEYSNCDNVSQDKIWKQAVGKEGMCLKNWETNWGFLAEFDAQLKEGKKSVKSGKKKDQEALPEKATVFSDHVPNTNSGNYGNRVNTELGSAMTRMEYQFYSGGRRRKLGDDMICY